MEGDVGVIVSSSEKVGFVHGPNGEYGCSATKCDGIPPTLGLGAVEEGYYYHFKDVTGPSIVHIFRTTRRNTNFYHGMVTDNYKVIP
jgi:hypothetical protein